MKRIGVEEKNSALIDLFFRSKGLVSILTKIMLLFGFSWIVSYIIVNTMNPL